MSTKSFVSRYRLPVLLAGLVVATVLWWLFRPEKLFVNQKVSEAAPAAIADAQPLFTGSLRGLGPSTTLQGRANIVKRDGGLVLMFTGRAGNADVEEDVYITASPVEGTDAVAKARKVGSIPAGTSTAEIALPTAVDPTRDKHILLVKNGEILSAATLEAF